MHCIGGFFYSVGCPVGREQGGGAQRRNQSHTMALVSPRVPTGRNVYRGRKFSAVFNSGLFCAGVQWDSNSACSHCPSILEKNILRYTFIQAFILLRNQRLYFHLSAEVLSCILKTVRALPAQTDTFLSFSFPWRSSFPSHCLAISTSRPSLSPLLSCPSC